MFIKKIRIKTFIRLKSEDMANFGASFFSIVYWMNILYDLKILKIIKKKYVKKGIR